mmetsp:Transcript_11988/g.39754  ORF Transcript_11988/g.39754 Transcript_11988/m.39754 type:complete len:200 (+) Transcript_11988:81-680(+)
MAACGMPFHLGGGFALRSSSKRPREGQPPARFKGVGVERLRPVAQLAERGPHSPRQRRGSVLERMAPRQPRVVAHEGRVAHGRVRVAHPLPRRVRQPQARHTPREREALVPVHRGEVLAQRLARHRQGGKVAAGRGALGDCPRERRRPHLDRPDGERHDQRLCARLGRAAASSRSGGRLRPTAGGGAPTPRAHKWPGPG